MIYTLLRPLAAIALRLYYRQIEAAGLERIPRNGPVLLVVNHPNALVDALVVGTLVPRRVYMTAKATIFASPLLGRFLRSAGVIPLRRARDEQATGTVDPNRNADAFRAVHQTLRAGHALMIFPEGISHDEPAMAPLRTGAARMALQARDDQGITGLTIVPLGLVFSRKDIPRTRVFVEVGAPIVMDGWTPAQPSSAVEELTAEITTRLRAVTLNFASLDDAAQATALAGTLARLLSDHAPALDASGPPLADSATIARRLERFRRVLPAAHSATRHRAQELVGELEAFQTTLSDHDLHPDDLAIPVDTPSALRFLARESWIVLFAAPIALWGGINHWLPIRAARALAMRSVESASDPAMRTIVLGAALLAITYAIQGALVAHFFGWLLAVAYLVSLPIAAEINFRFQERLRRAIRRARAFQRFRRDPAFHDMLVERTTHLGHEARALDTLLATSSRRV